MTKLTESAVYSPAIFRLETNTPVAGGPVILDSNDDPIQGHANAQAQLLANRTKYLKGITDTLGTAATANVQTSTTDTTAGALMAVGAFGLGGGAAITYSGDLNLLNKTGFYRSSAGSTNLPPTGLDSCFIHTSSIDTHSQTVVTYWAGDIYTRGGVGYVPNIVWTPWRKLYAPHNILGTVSQSAGVPTGAIIERGSNANGEYVRWADGTQICSGPIPSKAMPAGLDVQLVDLPAVFSSVTGIAATAGSPDLISDTYGFVYATSVFMTQLRLVYRNGATAQNSGSGSYIVTGRWY